MVTYSKEQNMIKKWDFPTQARIQRTYILNDASREKKKYSLPKYVFYCAKGGCKF
jgi:hypothetical protein